MDDRTLIISIVAAYMVVCLGIGVWASRRTRSAADFFIAGKRLGVLVFGIASFSTLMSGFGFIGGPGLVYSLGTSSLWICLAGTFGFCVTALLVAKRLRVFAEAFDVLTLPDAIAARYSSRTCRLLAAIVILLGVIGYLGTQIAAFGTVAESVFEIDARVAILAGTAVVLFYSVAGGIIASLYTDLFQGALMVVASLALFVLAMKTAGDGSMAAAPARITEAAMSKGAAAAVGPWGLAGPMLCLSWLFLFAFGGAGQPHVVTKFFMVRGVRAIRGGVIVSVIAYFVCALLWVGVGFAVRYLVDTGRAEPLDDPDHAAPYFLLNHTPPWLAGVVLAGLCSAIMSTADAFLNLGAAVFVHDFPRALLGRSVRRELFWARTATAIIAVAAAAFALAAEDLVAVLGIMSWGTFAAALTPVLAIGFNWKRATWQAAAAAMATGLVVHLGLEALELPKEAPVYTLPHGIDSGAAALLLSSVVFVAVSFATRRPALPPRVAEAIDL